MDLLNMILTIAFRNDYGTLCGMLDMSILSSISHDNLMRILEILQIRVDIPYKSNDTINIHQVCDDIQNICGESSVVRLDRNLEAYGLDEIRHMLSSTEQKLVIFKDYDTHLAVCIDEEGSSSMIEEMLNSHHI